MMRQRARYSSSVVGVVGESVRSRFERFPFFQVSMSSYLLVKGVGMVGEFTASSAIFFKKGLQGKSE